MPICNICESDKPKPLITKDGCNIYQCPSCGLGFTHPQPTSLDAQYDSAYFDLYRRRRAFRLKRGDNRLKRIELLKAPGRLLDVGCSLGYFVEAAMSRGWQASGVEISPYASAEARELGLDVKTGILENAGYTDGAFDCVTMWDVLEHVPDPTQHMLEVRRVLAPEGLVVVGTPNLAHVAFRRKRESWRHLKPKEHIFYFQDSSIGTLLEKTGFVLVTPPVLGGRRFPGSLSARLANAFARIAQPNDVMIVYAAKTS